MSLPIDCTRFVKFVNLRCSGLEPAAAAPLVAARELESFIVGRLHSVVFSTRCHGPCKLVHACKPATLGWELDRGTGLMVAPGCCTPRASCPPGGEPLGAASRRHSDPSAAASIVNGEAQLAS